MSSNLTQEYSTSWKHIHPYVSMSENSHVHYKNWPVQQIQWRAFWVHTRDKEQFRWKTETKVQHLSGWKDRWKIFIWIKNICYFNNLPCLCRLTYEAEWNYRYYHSQGNKHNHQPQSFLVPLSLSCPFHTHLLSGTRYQLALSRSWHNGNLQYGLSQFGLSHSIILWLNLCCSWSK